MPDILPTPDEIARMGWREREKAMLRARRTMAANQRSAAFRHSEPQPAMSLDETMPQPRGQSAVVRRAVADRLAADREPVIEDFPAPRATAPAPTAGAGFGRLRHRAGQARSRAVA